MKYEQLSRFLVLDSTHKECILPIENLTNNYLFCLSISKSVYFILVCSLELKSSLTTVVFILYFYH